MKISRIENSSGICLAELMIAMAAGMVVLSSTIQVLNHLQHRLSNQHDTVGLHQDERIGVRILEEELRLADPASSVNHALLLRAHPQEIEFYANVGGYSTHVTEAVLPLQQELSVVDGSGWKKGKRILICSGDRCAENHLARDGQRLSLTLANPVTQAFPLGSEIVVSNQVRYYLSRGGDRSMTLMRQVDGGASSVVNNVTFLAFRYVDKFGKPTMDPTTVSRVKVDLVVGSGHQVLTTEVGLRG